MMMNGFLELCEILSFVLTTGYEGLDGCELRYEFVVVAITIVLVAVSPAVVSAI